MKYVLRVVLFFSVAINLMTRSDMLLSPGKVVSDDIFSTDRREESFIDTEIDPPEDTTTRVWQVPSTGDVVESVDMSNPKTTFSAMAEMVRREVKHQQRSYEFTITEEWKKLIEDIRSHKRTPALLSEDKFDEWLCAWYLFELTSLIWWPEAPRYAWMLEPKTRQPADAWELPYTYRRRGGTVPFEISKDIGRQIKQSPQDYPRLVDGSLLEKFFREAFHPSNYFWDIGFLYAWTRSLHRLWLYDNYNSHIVKNMWLSSFSFVINEDYEHPLAQLQWMLWCSDTMWPHMMSVIQQYEWRINGVPAWLWNDGVRKTSFGEVIVKKNDVLSYSDVTVAHFFQWPRVDSLLQLSCQWEFYPINVVQINPKFLEPHI